MEMPKRPLKKYSVYLKRLELFAHAIGVKIEYLEGAEVEGIWLPTLRKIKIEADQPQSSEIASILHELGHAIDDMLSMPSATAWRYHKAYEAFYNSKNSKLQRKLVLQCEKRAWNNGREIASRLNIRLGKWYDQAERVCLNTYRYN